MATDVLGHAPGSVEVGAVTAGTRRVGAALLIGGALIMVAGAGVWASTGTDVAAALTQGEIESYLAGAHEHAAVLAWNLGLWLVGAPLLGLGLVVLVSVEPGTARVSRAIAMAAAIAGATLAEVAFLMWFGLIRVAGVLDVAAAEAWAWTAWNIDVLATSLLIGVGPLALAFTAAWMPRWLRVWAGIAAIAAVASWIAIPTGGGATFGMVIVPVGILWCAAAGIVAMRRPCS